MNAPASPRHLASPAEQREAELARLMRENFAAMRTAYLGGNAPTIKFVCDGFSEFMADNDVLAALIRTTLTASHKTAGADLAEVISNVMQVEAERLANEQFAQMEREHQEANDDARIERAVYDQNMRIFGWGGMG